MRCECRAELVDDTIRALQCASLILLSRARVRVRRRAVHARPLSYSAGSRRYATGTSSTPARTQPPDLVEPRGPFVFSGPYVVLIQSFARRHLCTAHFQPGESLPLPTYIALHPRPKSVIAVHIPIPAASRRPPSDLPVAVAAVPRYRSVHNPWRLPISRPCSYHQQPCHVQYTSFLHFVLQQTASHLACQTPYRSITQRSSTELSVAPILCRSWLLRRSMPFYSVLQRH